MLKIKEGKSIQAYGSNCESFTSKSKLSQEVLEHLKTRFPNEIEQIKEVKNLKNKIENGN